MRTAQSNMDREKHSDQRWQRLTNGHLRPRRRQRRQPKRKQNEWKKTRRKSYSGLRSFYGAINLMKHAMWTHWAGAGVQFRFESYALLMAQFAATNTLRESETRHDQQTESKLGELFFSPGWIDMRPAYSISQREVQKKKKKKNALRVSKRKKNGSIMVVLANAKRNKRYSRSVNYNAKANNREPRNNNNKKYRRWTPSLSLRGSGPCEGSILAILFTFDEKWPDDETRRRNKETKSSRIKLVQHITQ